MGIPPGLTFPIPGITDRSGDVPSPTGSGTSISEAAASAQHSADVSSRVMQQVMQNVVPFQGDVSQMIQNRPQVMLPQPVHPKPAQMGQPNLINATTGAGRRRNDISTLISSVGNIVKGSVNQKREKEDRDLMADLALIQAAASNPQDPHNQAILNSIAQDPKRVKRLEKAVGYNPLGGEPPSPETQTMIKFAGQSQQKQQAKHQQLTQAIASQLGPEAAQQGGGSASTTIPGQPSQPGGAMGALLSRSPNTAQLNPVIQLQASLIKAGVLPKADTSLNAMMGLMSDIMTNDAKYAEIQGKLQQVDKQLAATLTSMRKEYQYKYDLEVQKESGRNQRTSTRADATVESARIRARAQRDVAKMRQENVNKRVDLARQHRLLKAEVDAIGKDITALDTQITQAVNDKDDDRKKQLIEEQQTKKELKNAKEILMDVYDKQGAQIEDKLKQSPTSDLTGGGVPDPDDMDNEDRIF